MSDKHKTITEDEQRIENKWVKGQSTGFVKPQDKVITLADFINQYNKKETTNASVNLAPWPLETIMDNLANAYESVVTIKNKLYKTGDNPIITDSTTNKNAVKKAHAILNGVKNALKKTSDLLEKLSVDNH